MCSGAVPVFDEIIISMDLMDKIESIDEFSGVLTCQAGCVLENLEVKANEKDFTIPLDLASRKKCHIGGNASTNACGLRFLRYGSLHESVLGLEVVKADGTVLNLLSNFKKDNTGYHLKNIFIGSEGTLGIITRISIQCQPIFESIQVAFMGFKDYNYVMKVYKVAKKRLGEIIRSCELIDQASLLKCIEYYNHKCPISTEYQFYLLLETAGSNKKHDREKMDLFLEECRRDSLILDAVLANTEEGMDQIWCLRRDIPDALLKDGYMFTYDITLPILRLYDIVPILRTWVGSLATCICAHGHFADSNIHLNITCPKFDNEVRKLLEPFVYEFTKKLNGSIASEHGIGFAKTQYVACTKKPEAIQMMKDLKDMMDPKGIMNPYKVIPQ